MEELFDQVLTTAKAHIFVYKHIIVEKKKKISNTKTARFLNDQNCGMNQKMYVPLTE